MSKPSKLYADNAQIEFSSGFKEPLKRSDGLRRAVLKAVGEPDDLFRIDLKQLHTPRHYRINIYRSIKDSVQMTDSYYVIATEDVVVYANPPLKKKYYDADLIALFDSV